ncbi:PEGA domain-containing protein [Candidatus Poribacteria bacterium]
MASKILILIISVLIILAGVLYFFVFTGIVKIDTPRPPGATVEIDGIVVGTTPIKKRVRTGVHQIRVFKGGFETWEGTEEVSGSASLVSVKLRFLLRSEPTGAEVIMDGESVGETETAIDLKPGAHTFEFRKDGYKSERFNAVVPPNASDPLPVVPLKVAEEKTTPTPEEWTVKEPPSEGFGVIQVTSIPDAQVYLDGYLKGETPLTIVDVLVGDYVITLSKEGFRDLRKTVYVKKDETTRFAGELKPESTE